MEQSKQVVIRQGGVGDSTRILEFFNREYPQYRRDSEFWHWINVTLGDSKSLITIAECDDKVVGHYCIIPQTLQLDGVEYSVGMGVHAIVDMEYRKFVSIVDITNHTRKLASDYGMVMLYGFPNQNYHIIQEKIERWDVVSRFDALEFDKSESNSKLEFKPIRSISESKFISLISNISVDTSMVSIKATPSYYYKRYINHPHSIYQSYFIYEDSALCGFVVLKIYEGNIGHIIDYYVDSDIDIRELITTSMNMLNVDKMIQWDTNIKFKKAMIDLGLDTRPSFKTNFLVKFIDKNFENNNKICILDVTNWNLPMGTSDAF
ncbi:GNAT family N-acetyltransferase [bacterium]|nr:GNAT family N-acetyltransferase [bacterium]